MPTTDVYLSAIAKYGLEVVAIVTMAVVFWKFFVGKLWPRLLQQADDAQQRFDDQSKAFADTLSIERHDFVANLTEQRKEFLSALTEGRLAAEVVFSEHREMIHTQQNLLVKMADTLTRVDENTRPGGRRK